VVVDEGVALTAAAVVVEVGVEGDALTDVVVVEEGVALTVAAMVVQVLVEGDALTDAVVVDEGVALTQSARVNKVALIVAVIVAEPLVEGDARGRRSRRRGEVDGVTPSDVVGKTFVATQSTWTRLSTIGRCRKFQSCLRRRRRSR
jgi:hypothetical protein